jgi:hypothetical protein
MSHYSCEENGFHFRLKEAVEFAIFVYGTRINSKLKEGRTVIKLIASSGRLESFKAA